ncbi:uncharacterized protein LOC111395500 [Olea europaea var. sylvestris]|uniref:uncharacterized protein LOC111395500 n=1 Tax=Olea europaea var. sylvestris TaxID=158386 RepID=UPI000C1D5308|nr:uncharacterized protein LOC111395500 [Olea europaea var. sylvestris]
MLTELKVHLFKAQQRMKQEADKHRRDVQFEVWELVYLKLRPYRQKSLAKRLNEKLSPRYYGPFKIESKVGRVTYKLKLPASSAIHSVFHLSQLRKAISSVKPISAFPPQLSATGEFILEPEIILGVRPNAGHTAASLDI